MWKSKINSAKSFQNRFLIVFLGIFSMMSGCSLQNLLPDPETPLAFSGEFIIRKGFFEKVPKVKLDGEWEFFWNKFVSRENPENLSRPNAYAKIPGYWNEISLNNQNLPAFGFATYRLKIKVSEPKDKLGLKIIDASSSYRVFWNGKLLAEAGTVAESKEKYSPSYKLSLIEISDLQEENEILYEIANFDHHKAGAWESLELGLWEKLKADVERERLLQMFVFGGLFLISIYHLSLFIHLREDYPGLLFGLFSLFSSIFMLLIENKLLLLFIPNLPWKLLFHLIYFSSFIGTLFFVLFIAYFYPNKVNRTLIKIFSFLLLMFILGVVFFPIYYFSFLLKPFTVLYIIIMAYISQMYVASLFKGEEPGIIGVAGFLVLFFSVANDLLHVNLIINTFYSLKFGFVFFIFTHSYILSKRYSRFYMHVQKLLNLAKKNNHNLISMKKNLELIVNERTQELQKVKSRIESVGKMTSEIVHDLKNPISSIMGFSELANDDTIGRSNRVEYLDIIHKEAKRLSAMSQRILDFVKGGTIFRFEKYDINQFLSEFQKLNLPYTKIDNLVLTLEKHDKPLYVEIDAEQMRRVISNIYANALEAFIIDTKNGYSIQTKIYPKDKWVCIEIIDNGPGIPEEIREQVFQPFVTSKKENGTGLGMSLAREIVFSHRGNIYFETESNRGTRFFIELPLCEVLDA